MIPSIRALSQYLLEDLHDYQDANRVICTESIASARRSSVDQLDNSAGQHDEIRARGESQRDSGGSSAYAEGFPGAFSPAQDPHHTSGAGRKPAQHADVEPYVEGRIAATGDAWYPGAHPAVVASNALLRSIAKKYRDLTPDSADEAAAKKFLRSNMLCRNWVYDPQHSGEEELFGLLKREVDDFLHPSGELLVTSVDQIFDSGRTGPGASLGANGVDFYTKLFSSKLTATSFEVYYQYAERSARIPVWGLAEFNRLMTHGVPAIVRESRVTFVPKDLTQTRSICTEPSLNMFFQLGLGEILTKRLRQYFGIDLSRQPGRNVRLARLGSRNGSVATIDLESASDSLSLRLCRRLFPKWFKYLLWLYRTPATTLKGERVALNMVSTMGNGFTFPLQTMLFACVVRAVACQMGVQLGRASNRGARWGVFGDDIICPTEMSGRVIALLRLIGFRVNSEKSYTERYGRFRESCGGDFYMGHNVRGVYIKTLRTPQSRYVAINLLNEWSARWKIPLPRAVGYLQDSVRHLAVPPFAPVDSGIRIPHDLTLNRYGLWVSKNCSYYYKCYEAWVPQLRIGLERVLLPPGVYQLKRRDYNPHGLWFSFLGGYVQSAGSKVGPFGQPQIPIALKQGERPRYRMRTKVAPFWGPSVQQVDSHPPGFWGWWNTIVPFNLRLTES